MLSTQENYLDTRSQRYGNHITTKQKPLKIVPYMTDLLNLEHFFEHIASTQ